MGADASDDGVLAGYSGLDVNDELPAAGLEFSDGTYSVRLVNDLEDPSGDPYNDTNDRMVAVCRGDTPPDGVAEIKVMVESLPYPAVTVNGNVLLTANVQVQGPCAGVHANGTVQASSGVVVQGPISASDSVIHWWTPAEEPAHATEITSGARPLEVPKLDPLDFCDDADYILRNGWQINMTATPDSFELGGSTEWSFHQAGNEYKLGGQPANLGTFCIHGNVSYTASVGSDLEPAPITLLATGAVSIGGKSNIAPAHPDNLLIVAGGDIAAGGQAGAHYSGLIYTENQCAFGGNPDIDALILCYNAPDSYSYEAWDLLDQNSVGNNTTVTYDCSALRQPPRATAWWE